MQDFLTLILGVSVVLQLAAAVFALRLIHVTGWKAAWVLIAAAVVLMAGRRMITLEQILSGVPVGPLDLSAELVALGISVLMLLGVAGIGTVFRSLQRMAEVKREGLERERSYRVLLSNLSGMAYRCRNDDAWTMEFVSDGCAKITGYQATDLIENRKLAFGDLVHPDDQDWLAKKCQANLDRHMPCSNEYRIINAAGKIVWVWDQAQGVYSDTGELLTIEGLITDITDRKKISETLRQERDFTDAVINTIGSVVTVLDRQGVIVQFNHAAQVLTGYTGDEVLGAKIWDVLLPADEKPAIMEVFNRLLSGDFPNEYENSWLTKSGDKRLLHWNNSALTDARGEVKFVIATGVDITERKQAELALARAGIEWAQAMDSFEDAVYLIELDDTVVRANQSFYEMTGLTPDQVIGKNINRVMHPHGESVPCPVCLARRERRDVHISLDQNIPNRFNRPVEIMVKIMRNETGDPLRILMAARDLTRTRKIEAELRLYRNELEKLVATRTADLEQANQELESFAYSVSHDLRSPLRAIDGFSMALLEDCQAALNEEGRTYLQRIRSAAQRMGDLIDDILQLSRVVRRPMEQSRVDLSGLARAVSEELRERHPDRDINCHVAPGMQAEADAGLLRIVLTNLLENAWKFTANQPRPVIEVGVCQAADGEHCFFVRDNGAGFDNDYKDKLFQPFHRLHTTDEFEGTGIGLATVARIIRRHGGRVWAEAIPGQGATFYFSLPDHPAPDA